MRDLILQLSKSSIYSTKPSGGIKFVIVNDDDVQCLIHDGILRAFHVLGCLCSEYS
ncbi:TPA: hypothetical protein MFM40_004901 [Klebsiella pneumoniae]|nr:hypothetical protein [Klebsiella pneumoniae]